MKVFRLIKSHSDSALLQNDLNTLTVWCNLNKLPLNIDKCKIMSFTRSRSPIINDYTINNIVLKRVFEFCDLGVTFDSTFSFNKHYLNITKKSSTILGFINRTCQDFTNSDALKILYFSLVRSSLEYNSVVWSPSSVVHIQSLEAIQNRFLRFISYKCNIPRKPHSQYTPLLNQLNMTTLAERRKIIDLKFLYKIVNGFLNCPELLSCLNFNIPHCRTRSANTFYISFQRTNYALCSPINRLMKITNDVQIDLFSFPSFDYFCNYIAHL
ncbi:uncharacterized protein LOC132950803 [Metopolophium dirhodum]|uniref:uncharacterized protein LOC132950803 n=1 Tax=Metopolophium dirhodum TaxID=44670 RepID=UPI00298F4A10|nr:uncharacterized protein LOC132950803 [Metopolophium dirhodum]